jgi:integrase-like protein
MRFYNRLTQPVLRRPVELAQYTSLAFGGHCRAAGVRPSMGSVGDAYDNAMCESFFATLECELLDRDRFGTQADARLAVFDFIEGWYNPRRRHSALDYLSPLMYERTAAIGDRPVPSGATIDQGKRYLRIPPQGRSSSKPLIHAGVQSAARRRVHGGDQHPAGGQRLLRPCHPEG